MAEQTCFHSTNSHGWAFTRLKLKQVELGSNFLHDWWRHNKHMLHHIFWYYLHSYPFLASCVPMTMYMVEALQINSSACSWWLSLQIHIYCIGILRRLLEGDIFLPPNRRQKYDVTPVLRLLSVMIQNIRYAFSFVKQSEQVHNLPTFKSTLHRHILW